MKDYERTFWGFIDYRNKPIEPLETNPNIIEMNKGEMFLASCMNILRHSYGFIDTVETGDAISKSGEELPLYTYPAIEYLTQFDFSTKRIFEFGSGGSTIFWMKRAKEVVSVENNPAWVEKLRPRLTENASILVAEGIEFPRKIREAKGGFDVIVVDSAGYRYDCAHEAIKKLAKGGIVILDNSDWHFNTAAMLKESGLLQVDMTGFKPCYSHTGTTSIFFHREFNFPTIAERQPVYGIGAKRLHSGWDKPAAEEAT
jgi:hypothetical protein